MTVTVEGTAIPGAPSSAALLAATGLQKRYGGITALDDAEFSARAGEVHALLGENGAGKSTFVKMLTGAVTPDAGELRIDGDALAKLTPSMARERGIAAVFQELSLIPHLTGAENIWFPDEPLTGLRTRSRKRMLATARDLLDRLGFPPVPLDIAVHELSIAERQLLEIAKAVAREPKILVLDEATSALGPAEVARVRDMARGLAAGGALCIYISHRLSEVRAVADRITVFRNGRTVASLDAAAGTDDEIIHQIIGRRIEQLYPDPSPVAPGDVILRARGLTVGHLLRGVDLDLHRGEILGVGGLQGQGQLQLFLRLFGALRGGGEIEMRGRPVRIRSPRQALGAGVGCALIPEDRQREGLLLHKSVRENLTLARLREVSRWGLVRPGREREVVDEAIGRFHVAVRDREQLAGTLSGGNQQKIVIGKFMLPRVDVLLWYDPTRGIDVGAKQEIFELMRRQADDGRAVLFFSTESDELVNVCDRVIVLAGGRISATLRGDALSDGALMRAALDVPSEDA